MRLSTLARDSRERVLAAAEGEPSRQGCALIYLYDLVQNKLINKISFFRHGVQSMAFSNCGKFLVAASVAEEGSMVILDVQQGTIVENGTVMLRELGVNKIVVNPSSDCQVDIDFLTVGNRGSFAIWQYDHKTQRILHIIPDMNNDLQHTDFTCATFTPKLAAPYNGEVVILGTADGCVVAMNP